MFKSWRPWRAWAVGALAIATASPSVSQGSPRVVTETGVVVGSDAGSVARFLGIPYAAPPVDQLRWQPPQAPARWRGERLATQFGPGCAQTGGFGVFAAPSKSEDCLTLNVFAPKERAASPRPVMVWLYGGAHYSGNAADYDGSALSSEGGVVVVTLNYRLGVLGFLSHPALAAEQTEGVNYGLLDQRFALQWVQRNIGRFGGDPDNVTLFGQSAGGSSILAALVAPSFKKLFNRAAIQSGGRLVTTSPTAARTAAEAFAVRAGCSSQKPSDLRACLRALSVDDILAVQEPFLAGVTLDGKLLPRPIGEALIEGDFHRVPVVVGITKDEQAFSLAARELLKGPQTAAGYRDDVEAAFGPINADAVLKAYPIKSLSPSETEIRTWHGARACIARWIAGATARWVPTFAYEFSDASAPSYFPRMSFPMGAYHTAELQYLFPAFRGGSGTSHPLSPSQRRLARTIREYWTSFAKSGTPKSAGSKVWPPYASSDAVLSLGLRTSVLSRYGTARNCQFWDQINRYR